MILVPTEKGKTKNDLVICVGADVCNRSTGMAVVSVAVLRFC